MVNRMSGKPWNKLDPRSQRELIGVHVQGELDAFLWSYNRIMKANYCCEHEQRAIEECFLLHARNLHDFLWGLSSHPDDVNVTKILSRSLDRSDAEDFMIVFGKERSGKESRINKQLSHITTDRLPGNQKDLIQEYRMMIYKSIKKGVEDFNEATEKKSEWRLMIK